MIRKQCRRYDETGQAHALTISCYRRLPLLSKDRTRYWLIDAIDEARKLAHFDLWAFVVMPEHVHLLVAPRSRSVGISQILWRIKRPVGRKAIGFLKSTAPTWLGNLAERGPDGHPNHRFWQAGDGYDRNVIDIVTAWRMIDYIHSNPVRRGLVERPEDWEWSSARWYAGIQPVVLEIDATLPPHDSPCSFHG